MHFDKGMCNPSQYCRPQEWANAGFESIDVQPELTQYCGPKDGNAVMDYIFGMFLKHFKNVYFMSQFQVILFIKQNLHYHLACKSAVSPRLQ